MWSVGTLCFGLQSGVVVLDTSGWGQVHGHCMSTWVIPCENPQHWGPGELSHTDAGRTKRVLMWLQGKGHGEAWARFFLDFTHAPFLFADSDLYPFVEINHNHRVQQIFWVPWDLLEDYWAWRWLLGTPRQEFTCIQRPAISRTAWGTEKAQDRQSCGHQHKVAGRRRKAYTRQTTRGARTWEGRAGNRILKATGSQCGIHSLPSRQVVTPWDLYPRKAFINFKNSSFVKSRGNPDSISVGSRVNVSKSQTQ